MVPVGGQVGAADHERAPDEEDAGLAQAVVLEAHGRRHVEDRDEEPAEGEDDDERADRGGQEEHDQAVDDGQDQDGVAQLRLASPSPRGWDAAHTAPARSPPVSTPPLVSK